MSCRTGVLESRDSATTFSEELFSGDVSPNATTDGRRGSPSEEKGLSLMEGEGLRQLTKDRETR